MEKESNYRGKITAKIDTQVKYEKIRKEKAIEELERNPRDERPYARTLNMMGRNAYLKEYFEGVLLENQTFPKIGDIEDVRKTKNFVNGYKSEMDHIDHAYRYGYLDKIEEEYKNNKTR